MKDFNIAKYLKEHNLGSHGILGRYVDLHGLKEEEDYGNNKPVDEVPYTGAEEKLDGFGDEFDQVEPVSEVEDGEENAWMENVDGSDAYTVGNWKCYYDHPGHLVWSYDDRPFSDIAVYATPGFDGDDSTPIQTDMDNETVDQASLGKSVFSSFEEYAQAVKPYLDAVEREYASGLTKLNTEIEGGMDDEDDSSDHFDKSVIAANMERIYDQFEAQILRLISNIVNAGYDPEDAAQFLRDYADHLEKQKL